MKSPPSDTGKKEAEEIPEKALSKQEDPSRSEDPKQENQEMMEAKEILEKVPLAQNFLCLCHGQSNRDRDKFRIMVISIVGAISFIVISCIFILFQELASRRGQILSGPACPKEWIGYQGKCYYFSTVKRNWTSSQHFCSSQTASLLIFSHNQEKDFVMNYKGKAPFWIGLQRVPGQPWKWTNGDNPTLEVIGDGGDCAFLSDGTATASRCRTELLWICSKLDVFNEQISDK